MFIPPEGAMQWEVERFVNGTPLPEKFAVWTKPGEPRNYVDAGGCVVGHPIIVESLPDPWFSITKEHMRTGVVKEPSMCTCWGKVIE